MKYSTTNTLLTASICGALIWISALAGRADLNVHWKLDEASGITAADSSGNGIDGTWQETVGAPVWVPSGGVDGGSVSISGVGLDSFITSTFSAVTATPLTISAWVKTTSTGNNGTLYLGNGASGNQYYVVRVQGGLAKVNARNPAEIQGTGTSLISDGEWHLVTGVYASPTDRRIYVDGVLEHSNATEVPEVILTRFGIGALTRNTPYNPADRFTGEIDEAALWDRAFTALDAAALNGLGVLRAGNAADLDPLVEAFVAQDTAIIAGRNWAYATGLAGAFGATSGTVAGLDASMVLDDLGNGMQITSAPGKPVINSYATSDLAIYLGESATLSWDISAADTIEIDQGVGAVANPTGTVGVSPTETTTYTLTATNGAGSVMPQVTITVIPQPVVVSFTATPDIVYLGEEITLAWEVENFTTLTIDQGIGPVTGPTGSTTVTPTEDTTYTFTATNANGSVTAMASVTVLPTPPARELLLHWPLDAGTGTTAADRAGANDGTFIETGGAITWTSGVMGGALEFPNANDVAVRAVTSLVDAYPFAMAGWVNTVVSENDTFINLGTGNNFDYSSLRVNAGRAQLTRRNAGFFDLAGPLVNDGGWHFVTGIFSHAKSRLLYVDGVLIGNNTADDGGFGVPDRFSIGALDRSDTSVVDAFGGSVDDVSFWRGILSADEIAALYGGGVGLGLNASDIAALLTGFEAQSGAEAGGLGWNYTAGLGGGVGLTGGSLAGGDASIVLDNSGNGMVAQPLEFSIISVVRGEGGRTISWESIAGRSYRIEFSPDLKDWADEVDDGSLATGETSSFFDSDAGRFAAPRGYYRVVLLPEE